MIHLKKQCTCIQYIPHNISFVNILFAICFYTEKFDEVLEHGNLSKYWVTKILCEDLHMSY